MEVDFDEGTSENLFITNFLVKIMANQFFVARIKPETRWHRLSYISQSHFFRFFPKIIYILCRRRILIFDFFFVFKNYGIYIYICDLLFWFFFSFMGVGV
ncbi:hypothetical protein ABFX02_14G228500 [Erythranthe guttata]